MNSQAQNHAFKEKRDLLIANTNLRLIILLFTRNAWDEAGMLQRGQFLTETELKLWPGPRPCSRFSPASSCFPLRSLTALGRVGGVALCVTVE